MKSKIIAIVALAALPLLAQQRRMVSMPKAGVCPLPTLPALPGLRETGFFTKSNVPHGIPYIDGHYRTRANRESRALAGFKKFDEHYAPLFKDPKTNDLFRVPLYMAAGETDIELNNGMKDLALFNQYGLRNFWALSTGGHEWADWQRYLHQTAQIMFPDCPGKLPD